MTHNYYMITSTLKSDTPRHFPSSGSWTWASSSTCHELILQLILSKSSWAKKISTTSRENIVPTRCHMTPSVNMSPWIIRIRLCPGELFSYDSTSLTSLSFIRSLPKSSTLPHQNLRSHSYVHEIRHLHDPPFFAEHTQFFFGNEWQGNKIVFSIQK